MPSCTGRLVAQIKRISNGTGFVDPTRKTCRDSRTRSSFACIARERLPISSRNSVPPAAVSNFPAWSAVASVNAPFTCPNSSLSNNVSGTAPMSTVMITSRSLAERRWIARATSSFPVPFSPRIRILASVSATFSIVRKTCRIGSLVPIISW